MAGPPRGTRNLSVVSAASSSHSSIRRQLASSAPAHSCEGAACVARPDGWDENGTDGRSRHPEPGPSCDRQPHARPRREYAHVGTSKTRGRTREGGVAAAAVPPPRHPHRGRTAPDPLFAQCPCRLVQCHPLVGGIEDGWFDAFLQVRSSSASLNNSSLARSAVISAKCWRLGEPSVR